MVDVFSEGFTKTDEQITKGKQEVFEEENYLVDEIPENSSLINISMRIPGRIKNNRYISRTFNLVVERFVNEYNVVKEVLWDLSSGPQAFLVVDKDPGFLKHETVQYEDTDPIGIIANINVFGVEDDRPSEITREELNLPKRKCFIGDGNADQCSASDKHTEIELREAINQIINDNVKF